MQQKNFLPKRALITGASMGLGKALADHLEANNVETIRVARKIDPPGIVADLTNREDRKKVLQAISEKLPDLIINNAGNGLYGYSIDLPIDEQLKIIELNDAALLEISLHTAKEWVRAGIKGTILNIGSAGGLLPYPTFNVYCASKAFVISFSQALDAELKSHGIRVLCACPGQINTGFRERASKGHPQKPNHLTMSMDKAVNHLMWQLEKKKPLYIFDWRTRVLILLSKCVPRPLLNFYLKHSLTDRFSK